MARVRVTGVHKGGQAQAPAARSSSIGFFLFVEVRGEGQGGIHWGWRGRWEEMGAGEMVGNVQEPLLASLDAPLPAPTEAPAEIRHRTPGPAAPCPYRPRVPSRSSNQARIGLGYTPVGCGAGMRVRLRVVAVYSVPEGRPTNHQPWGGKRKQHHIQGKKVSVYVHRMHTVVPGAES